MRRMFDRVIDPERRARRREKAERQRQREGAPHVVEYFHQLDDPYSHLAAQVLGKLAERYDIEIVPRLIRASGGLNQPEPQQLTAWARRDAELIAPHYGLEFPAGAPDRPAAQFLASALRHLAGLSPATLIAALPDASAALWAGAVPDGAQSATDVEVEGVLASGNDRLASLGHYSGAMFYCAGEWYWGVDRLSHLEQRLRDLGACRDPSLPYLCPRPAIEIGEADASGLTLDFYASLNSPYTSIIFDRTVAMARACGIRFNFKPVLPMIMRGVPATRAKGLYIMFDTKREAEQLGVDFGPVVTPIGSPTRRLYSLLAWAKGKGRDIELMSAALRLAFSGGVGLHRLSGLRRAVEIAGLDWSEACLHLEDTGWRATVAGYQAEMSEELGLWGVPSYRLSGRDGEGDLCVWGQDRLWLVAAEIRRRAALASRSGTSELG